MKHKHYEMIVAKAANMELVVFVRDTDTWRELNQVTPFYEYNDYFPCLPQHKEAVLNSLNGGVALYESPREKGEHALGRADWKKDDWYMQDDCKSRIKPKKEKRWIAINIKTHETGLIYNSYESCRLACKLDGFQVCEIEVEV